MKVNLRTIDKVSILPLAINFVGVRWLIVSVLASGTSGPDWSSCQGVMLCSRVHVGTGL